LNEEKDMGFLATTKKIISNPGMVVRAKPILPAKNAMVESSFRPIIINGGLVDVQIHGMDGFRNYKERQFFIDCMVLLSKGFASDKFKVRVLNSKVKYSKGLTEKQAYDLVISGWCQQFKKADGDFDIYIILYTGRRKTVGYTYGNLKVWTNRLHFLDWMVMEEKGLKRGIKGEGLAMGCGHFFHEGLHLQGFTHPTHKGSLTYEWGYIMRDVCKGIAQGETFTPTFHLPAKTAA
jgi:hypothetical protein